MWLAGWVVAGIAVDLLCFVVFLVWVADVGCCLRCYVLIGCCARWFGVSLIAGWRWFVLGCLFSGGDLRVYCILVQFGGCELNACLCFLVYGCGFLGGLDDCFLCLLGCFVVML